MATTHTTSKLKIRRWTEATDEEIMLSLEWVADRYPNRDIRGMLGYIRWSMSNPNRLVLVGESSFGAAMFNMRYGIEPQARLDFIVSRTSAKTFFEPIEMIQLMKAWAKEKGAHGPFILDSDTVDLAPLGRFFGGTKVTVEQWHIPNS